MLMRSTGLGKTELSGKVDSMQRQGDYLIMYVDVVDPVKWKLRVGLNFRDLMAVVLACGRRPVIRFLFSPRQWFNRNPEHPESF